MEVDNGRIIMYPLQVCICHLVSFHFLFLLKCQQFNLELFYNKIENENKPEMDYTPEGVLYLFNQNLLTPEGNFS